MYVAFNGIKSSLNKAALNVLNQGSYDKLSVNAFADASALKSRGAVSKILDGEILRYRIYMPEYDCYVHHRPV